jgi:hypothetical protein
MPLPVARLEHDGRVRERVRAQLRHQVRRELGGVVVAADLHRHDMPCRVEFREKVTVLTELLEGVPSMPQLDLHKDNIVIRDGGENGVRLAVLHPPETIAVSNPWLRL